MTEENELARLEGFVSGLLERFNALQADNMELTERLERREETIENLHADIASMTDERGEISSRVSSLIGKIEDWEISSDVSVEGDDGEDSDENSDEKSSDSGLQGNLFEGDA